MKRQIRNARKGGGDRYMQEPANNDFEVLIVLIQDDVTTWLTSAIVIVAWIDGRISAEDTNCDNK